LELARIGLDARVICAGLLHDILEDTPTEALALKERFGEEITSLVEGVTKISVKMAGASAGEELHAENFRRMLLAVAKDIRVLLIKLADRLHNIRTLGFLREPKQQRIAKETLEVYAP